MSVQTVSQATKTERFQRIVNILAFAVYDKVYGPVDRMARAVDKSMVISSLYEVLRYVSTEIRRCYDIKAQRQQPRSEEDVERCEKLEVLTNFEVPHDEVSEFLEDVERRGVDVAKRVAVQALAYGLNLALKPRQKPQQRVGEAGG